MLLLESHLTIILLQLPLLPILFAGLLMFGLALQARIHWIVVLIGGAIYYAAFSGSTGLLQTYMLESYLVEPMNAMACVHLCFSDDRELTLRGSESSSSGNVHGALPSRSSFSNGVSRPLGGTSTSYRRSSSLFWEWPCAGLLSFTVPVSGVRRVCLVRITCKSMLGVTNEWIAK
jgi:hypothetical protein